MSPSYFLVIPIDILWPLVALGVTFARFGELPGDGEQVAAAVLGFLLVERPRGSPETLGRR
jgi:hypothetical protein